MSNTLNISAPWVSYYRKLNALFGDDPAVRVEYIAADGNDPEIKLYVEGTDKAEAINALLPDEVTFGNVTVPVTVIPANVELTKSALFAKAFEGNPALSYVANVDGVLSNPVTFVVFRHKVVQYFNDNLMDVNGNETTLYQTIANSVFDVDGVFFSTDTVENLGKPV